MKIFQTRKVLLKYYLRLAISNGPFRKFAKMNKLFEFLLSKSNFLYFEKLKFSEKKFIFHVGDFFQHEKWALVTWASGKFFRDEIF